jgi:hypothetical protein
MDSGVLSAPQQTGSSFEEFTHVPYKDKHLVYASYVDTNGSAGALAFGIFSEWTGMASVDQLPSTCKRISSRERYRRLTCMCAHTPLGDQATVCSVKTVQHRSEDLLTAA